MSSNENIIVIPKNRKQSELVKALLSEMKIEFKSTATTTHNVLKKKIDDARDEKKKGDLLTIEADKVWESI